MGSRYLSKRRRLKFSDDDLANLVRRAKTVARAVARNAGEADLEEAESFAIWILAEAIAMYRPGSSHFWGYARPRIVGRVRHWIRSEQRRRATKVKYAECIRNGFGPSE